MYIFSGCSKNHCIDIFLQKDFPELCRFRKVTEEDERAAPCLDIHILISKQGYRKYKAVECTWLCNCDRAQGVMGEKNKKYCIF